MADFRVTFFFEGGGAHGWTESYYYTEDTHDLVVLPANQLRYARRQCLSSQWRIQYTRISNADRIRDAKFQSHGATGEVGLLSGGNDPSPQSQYFDAVYLRAFSGTRVWRSIHLRGIPNDALTPNANLNTSSIFYGNVQVFKNQLISDNWRLRKKTTSEGVQGITITARQGGKAVEYAYVPSAVVLSPEQLVEIKGVSGFFPVNGIWRVQTVDTGIFTTYPKRRELVSRGGYAPGYAVPFIYEYPLITDIQDIRGADKKTGRPSYLRPGRASPQKV